MSNHGSELMWFGKRNGVGYVGAIDIRTYPDGVPLILWDDCDKPERLLLRARSLLSFIAAMYFADSLRFRGYPIPELILPCVPGARQDRLNDSGDYLFTLKSVANEINARGFPCVTLLDPHSSVTPALIERCRVIESDQYFEGSPCEWSAVVAPDGSAEKRATAVAKLLRLPLLHAWKKRDTLTGRLSGFGIQPINLSVSEGRLLFVDDLCDGGGTFIGLAAETAKFGREADLFVTHGYFSKGIAPLLESFRRVIVTDSVIGTDAVLDESSPEPAAARLNMRINQSRDGRVQIISVCERLLRTNRVKDDTE